MHSSANLYNHSKRQRARKKNPKCKKNTHNTEMLMHNTSLDAFKYIKLMRKLKKSKQIANNNNNKILHANYRILV